MASALLLILLALVPLAQESGAETKPETKPESGPWTSHQATDGMLLAMRFLDRERAVAVGGSTQDGPSIIVVSDDGGRSWQPRPTSIQGRLYALDFPTPERGYAVGYGTGVLRTRDRGDTWEVPEGGPEGWLASVDFVSERVGFVVGSKSRGPLLARTRDGGDSWEALTVPAGCTAPGFRDVLFLDAELGFVGGGGGFAPAYTRRRGRMGAVDLRLRGLAAGACPSPIATSATWPGRASCCTPPTGGDTWRQQPLPVREKLNDVLFLDPRRGWYSTAEGGVFETLDGGRTWSEVCARPGDGDRVGPAGGGTVHAVTDDGRVLSRPLPGPSKG